MNARNRMRLTIAGTLAAVLPVLGQTAPESPSLMAQTVGESLPQAASGLPHGLRDASMFAITPPEVRVFKPHDLVQIIVRETSRANSKHELETQKDYALNGSIDAWPHLSLSDILNLQLRAGDTTDLPTVGVSFDREFQGEGDYKREDDLAARLTAEIIEILPNGNLILEAQTRIKTDEEISEIKVTGVCRQDDVTAANTVMSNQIHNLRIQKNHQGELRKSTKKGILAKFLDALFAF